MLKHTEDPDCIYTAECPAAAAAQLQRFSYSRTYSSPPGDLLGDPGCECQGHCSTNDCSCAQESTKGLSALQVHVKVSGVVRLLECGPACCCGQDCAARTTQQGLSVKVTLKWSDAKGWCVFAAQAIPQGSFVCQYVGEYVTAAEARRRLAAYDQDTDKGHALLTVRLQLPSHSSSLLCCIDATLQGNIARFMNHSCDGGNLEAILVSMKGYMLPRVALFAAREIQAGEELTYAYCHAAENEAGEGPSMRVCHCGTAACSGYLPSAL